MSQDEALRMSAEVVDKFSPALRALRSQLQGLARAGADHSEMLQKGFNRVTGAAQATERAVASGLTPAVRTLGVTSLSATAAIVGIGAAMRSFATGAAGLGQLSRDTGVAAETLRNFEAVASKFNVTQDAAAAGAQNFADKMRQFSRGTGDLWAWINQQGRTGEGRQHFQAFAADLAKTKDTGDQLRKALEELENIKDPRERRIFAQEFFGNADIARLADGTLGKLKDVWAKTAGRLGPLDPKAVETAEKFNRTLADLGSSAQKLGMTLGQEFLPYATQFTTWLDDLVAGKRDDVTKGLREGIRGIKEELDKINWKQAGEDAVTFLRESTALAGTLAKAFHEVNESIRAWREGKYIEAIRRLDGASGPTARALAPLPGDDKIAHDEAAGKLRGQIEAEKDRLGSFRELLGELEESGDKAGAQRAREALEKNSAHLKSLEEQLKRLTDQQGQGGATVQQQSFDGTAAGSAMGALIQKAALGVTGRGGYGSGGGGTQGERLFGHPTGSNALGDPYRAARERAIANDPSAEWRRRIMRGERGVPLPGGGGLGGSPSEAADFGKFLEERGVPADQRASMMREFRRRRGLDPNSGAGRAGRALRGDDGGGAGAANPDASRRLADAIAGTESGRGGYDTVLGNGRYGLPDKPVSQMTLDEAYAFGRQVRRRHGSSSALGRYQIVGSTMREAQHALGLSGDTPFDAETQDRMMRWIARNQGLGAWEGLKRNPRAMAAARRAIEEGGARDAPRAITGNASPTLPRTRGYQPDGTFYDGRWTYRRGADGHMTRGPLAGAEDGLRQIKPWTKASEVQPTRVDMEDDGGMYAGSGALKKDPDALPSLDDMLGKEAAEGVRRERLNEQWRRAQAIGKAYDTGDFRGAFVDEMKRRAERGERYGQREDEKVDRGGDRGTTLDDLRRHLAPDPFTDAGGDGEDRSAERFSRAQGRVTDPAYKPERELTLDEIRRKYAAPRDAEDERQKSLQLSPAARGALRSGAGVGAAGVDGQNGRVDLHVINPGPNTRVEPKATGSIFRDIKQTRGRPMAMGGEDV